MNILILDEWLPYPADTGKKIRTSNLLARLAQGNNITYLCFHKGDNKPDLSKLPDRVELVLIPDRRTKKGGIQYWLKVLLNLFQQDPFSVEYSYLKEMENRLRELLNGRQYDLLICEWTPYAHYFRSISHPCKVLMAHNVEFQQWQRMYEISKNHLKKILFKDQWHKMYRFEQNHFILFRSIISVSDLDKNLVHKMSNHREIFVVENGVDVQFFKPLHMEEKGYAIFSASMDAFTNQNAALQYADKILPLVRQKEPSLDFYIVGRNPSKSIKNLAKRKGIVVTGTVDDVRPFTAQSSVAVVPLLAGGGTRLKILEAMAMGIPVVSTSIGAEGLHVKHEENILIADTEEDFADCVLRCSKDRRLKTRLTSNALNLVKNNYSWDHLGKKLNSYLNKLVTL